MNAGRVQMLMIIGESNPVQTAPADLKFAEAMSKVQTRFHSGLFVDETTTLCHWHVPAAHYLEAWSDARTIDGTVSIVQPLIQPMYGGKSAHEIVATLLGSARAQRLRPRSRVLDGRRNLPRAPRRCAVRIRAAAHRRRRRRAPGSPGAAAAPPDGGRRR